jgi:hypothetical protein
MRVLLALNICSIRVHILSPVIKIPHIILNWSLLNPVITSLESHAKVASHKILLLYTRRCYMDQFYFKEHSQRKISHYDESQNEFIYCILRLYRVRVQSLTGHFKKKLPRPHTLPYHHIFINLYNIGKDI